MDEKQLMSAFTKMLMNAAGEAQKHDLAAGFTLTTNFMHGTNGIFGASGVSQDVFSSRVKPEGIFSVLDAFGARDTNPIVGYLTGFTAGDATTQDAPCDEPPSAGNIKSCFQGSAFGRYMAKTDPIQMDRIGEIMNRGEMTDLRVVNDPILNSSIFTPQGMAPTATSAIRQEILARFLALGAHMESVLCPMLWTGDPANNSNNSGYMEFNGFQNLVVTTHTDVLTGASCPSLASDVKDANYLSVNTDAATIFYYLTTMYRYLEHNRKSMGFGRVQWVWVMPDSLFRELSDYWPCVYATHRCTVDANTGIAGQDGLLMRRMADEMYNGKFLEIDGVRLPVVVDDCMPIDTNTTNAHVPNPCMGADIYLIPLTVMGGRPVTYLEYFDFNGPMGVAEAIALGFAASDIMVADGGRFLITKERTRVCMEWDALTKLRLRLLVPQLAGRLQNVVWCPLQAYRAPFPTQNYFVDGGNTTGSWSQYYADRYQ